MHFDPKNYRKYYAFNVLDNNYHMLNNNLLIKIRKKVATPQNWAKITKNKQKIRTNIKQILFCKKCNHNSELT